MGKKLHILTSVTVSNSVMSAVVRLVTDRDALDMPLLLITSTVQVGMTRAKDRLFISASKKPSQFIDETCLPVMKIFKEEDSGD